jgi:hypothetical protein
MPEGTIDSRYSILMLRGVMGLGGAQLDSSLSRVVFTLEDPDCEGA